MDQRSTVMDYPTLFIPKKCTPLETNCEISDNVYIDLNITTPDTEGNNKLIYSGFCNVKLIDSHNMPIEENPTTEVNEVEQMPVILSEANHMSFPSNDSVWIDPSQSPHVYNHYDTKLEGSTFDSRITVEQHNTYITQNVYNYKDTEEHRRGRKDINELYNESELECGVFLSRLPEEIRNETRAKAKKEKNYVQNENNALKQLMSEDMQPTSKQRKTILFLGNEDSHLGHTIQNISYNDPMLKCSEKEVDNELISESSSSLTTPVKKKYQCDKCKQIFDQISAFRQHMVGDHTHNFKAKDKEVSFVCIECGKNYKNQMHFEKHCLGHGDPDLECPKCHKVYATKFTLRAHQKIHNRKFCCNLCSRSYVKAEDLKSHIEKIHIMVMCNNEQCSFIAQKASELNEHICENETESAEFENDVVNEVEVITENLKSENLKETEDTEEITENSMENTIYFDGDDDGEDEIGAEHLNSNNIDLKTTQDTENICTDSSVGKVMSNKIYFDDDEDDFYEGDEINEQLMTEQNLKSDLESKETQDRIRKADSVLAKVMSNEIFLLNPEKSRKHGRYNKACEVCSKKFDRIGDLKRHLIEHVIRSTLAKSPVSRNGTLKILCEICKSVTFTKVDKYKGHLREHAKLTLYKCIVCDKSFSDSSNFSKHKKIHGISYFQCDLCQRKFNSKKMIAQHMEYHIKNKPVKCKFCNKKFHFPSMLNKHMKCSHGEASSIKYNCRFCESSFQALKVKWDHEWTVHNVRKMIIDCLICESKFRKYSELKRHCHDVHNVSIPLSKHILRKKRRH